MTSVINKEEDGEDEMYEAFGRFDWRREIVLSPTSEEQEEDGEDKRCEAFGSFDWRREIHLSPTTTSEEQEENECGEYEEDEDKAYKLLKLETYEIKDTNGELGCPFCVGYEKQGYNRLLSHAVRVAGGFTESAMQRANHSAMVKYLVVDLAHYANRILSNFTHELDLRIQSMDQLKSKYEEKTMSVRTMLQEMDETQHTFFEEASNMLRIVRDQSKSVLEQQEMLNFDYENKRRRLNCWSQELKKREATLAEEKRKMEDLVREKNDLAKERRPNDELLEVGEELMKGLEDMPSHCCVKIGVERLHGETDEKLFMSECKKRKMRDDNGNPQRPLNEKLLGGLEGKLGNKIYNAAVEVEQNSNGNGNCMELHPDKNSRASAPSRPSQEKGTSAQSRSAKGPSKATAAPSEVRVDTFWTTCYHCRMKYKYLKIYLNCCLRCLGCRKSFMASEIDPPAKLGNDKEK